MRASFFAASSQVKGIILANVLPLRGFGMNNSDFADH
jgi:hypothetical protein